MQPDDNENLNLALDIFHKYQLLLEEVAWTSVTDFELKHNEVVVVCGCYNSFWQEFIEALNPEAEDDAIMFYHDGLEPISISLTTRDGFADQLTEIPTDISIPESHPDKDKVWLLILHQKGHRWLQLSATAPRKLTS